MNRQIFILVLLLALFKSSLFAQTNEESSNPFLVLGYQQYKDGKYDSSIYNLEIASKDLATTNQYEDYIYSLLYLGRSHENLANYKKAEHYLNQALKICLKHLGESHDATARIYNGFDNNLTAQAKYEEALKYSLKALTTRIAIYGEKHKAVIESYNAIAFNIRSLGNYDSALVWYNNALKLEKEVYDNYENQSNTARTLYGIGWVLSTKGQFPEALEYFIRSAEVSQNVYGKGHPSTSQKLKMVAWCASQLGDYKMALDYGNKAAEIRMKKLGKDHPFMATTYHDLGRTYMMLGEYEKAISYQIQGNRIWINKHGTNDPQMPNFHNNLGLSYFKNGDYQNALSEYKKAEEIALNLKGANRIELANTYSRMADLFETEKNFDRQFKCLKKSLEMSIDLVGADHVNIASLYRQLGHYYAREGNHEQELEYFEKALTIYENRYKGKHPIIAQTISDIADHYQHVGQYAIALEQYQKSLMALSSEFEHTDLFANPEVYQIKWPIEAIHILSNKARVIEKMGDDKELLTYQRAVELINEIKKSYVRETSKEILYKNSSEIYYAAINSCLKLYDKTEDIKYLNEAFKYSEDSKSMILFEVINSTAASTYVDIPDSITQELDLSKKMVVNYNEYLFNAEQANDEALISRYKEKLFYEQNKRDQLVSLIEDTYPDYYNLKYAKRSTDIPQIQNQLLNENSALIEYFFGDKSIIVFTIQKDAAHVDIIDKPFDFEQLVSDYRNSITNYQYIINNSVEADLQYINTSSKLYDLLISHSKNQLTKNINNLIIVPDGPIWHVNFQTLLTSKPDLISTVNYSQLPYLIKDYNSSFAYSAGILTAKHSKPKSTVNFAGFAPNYKDLILANEDSISHNMLALLVRNGEYNLPGALTEVLNITEVMDGVSFLGEEATEGNFKKSGQNYDVIHLAMHSLLNDQNPQYSELIFSKSDSVEDGYLSISEIYNMKLNAQLIVLSACNSGYGEIQQGEGPISLSRAFNYAGCPSVVMSMWKIPDEATHLIMIDFYKNLKQGLSKDEALRKAQLNYLKNNNDPLQQHPFYWASFLSMGDTQPIAAPFDYSTLIFYLCLGVLLLAITFRNRITA